MTFNYSASKLAMSIMSFYLLGCDGSFHVKQDIPMDVIPNKTCVENSIKKILPESRINHKDLGRGEAIVFSWDGPSRDYFGIAEFIIENNQKPKVELSSGGITAPTQSAMGQARSAGSEILGKIAAQIESSCNRAVLIK